MADMKAPDRLSNPAGADAPRHVYGPRAVGALLPGLMRPAFRKRAPAATQVMADWEAIVGPKLAVVTAPRKLSAGTLTIACAGPMALELQHLAEALMARINSHVGRDLVQRLRFIQEAPSARVPEPPRPRPTPQAVARAEAAVADMPPGELRDALAALGRAVLTPRTP